MEKVDLNKVFFKLKIDGIFTIPRSRYVVTGRIEAGRINNDSKVLITNIDGNVLKNVAIVDIDWFDRTRCDKNITAFEGMGIGIILEGVDKEILSIGNYIVIE